MIVYNANCFCVHNNVQYSHRKEVNMMARKKKSGNKDKSLGMLVFATAILNLVQAVFGLIEKLLE